MLKHLFINDFGSLLPSEHCLLDLYFNHKVALDFLHAQSLMDLDLMCSYVTDDIVYINEPFPEKRDIRGSKMFRDVFEGSPCIWGQEANLQIIQSCCRGSTVFVTRLDQFLVDGHWIKIPINGFLKIKDGKVAYWKDYWCYKKYREFIDNTYPQGFSLFKKTRVLIEK